MGAYILRRILLIVPTLLAIITINFFIVQIAPGGPIDLMYAQMSGIGSNMIMERISGEGQQEVADDLYNMAWNACAARPGTVDQIWVGVTCTENPDFLAGHGCALGQRIGSPP